MSVWDESLHRYATLDDVERARAMIALGADIDYVENGCSVLDVALMRAGAGFGIFGLLLSKEVAITPRTLRLACALAGEAWQKMKGNAEKGTQSFLAIVEEEAIRREMALRIIAKAPKEAFLGADSAGRTIFDHAAQARGLMPFIRKAMEKHGIEEDIQRQLKIQRMRQRAAATPGLL